MSNRRKLIQLGAALPALSLFSSKLHAGTQNPALEPTIECTGSAQKTRAQSAGPFFTPQTPLRNNFRAEDKNGRHFQLLGIVKSRDCKPVANALIELWHADSQGRYDNRGYRMRGHQFTDDSGQFVFFTTVPGHYPGRTRHFHVKVQARGQLILTTQLYFPDDSQNKNDGIFHRSLVMNIGTIDGTASGRFDFIVETS